MNFDKFFIREDGKKYDETKRRAASQRAILYYLVALYIGYMGYSIMNSRLAGDDTMSYPLAITFTCVLLMGAVGVAWYATKRMRHESAQSEIEVTGEEEEQE